MGDKDEIMKTVGESGLKAEKIKKQRIANLQKWREGQKGKQGVDQDIEKFERLKKLREEYEETQYQKPLRKQPVQQQDSSQPVWEKKIFRKPRLVYQGAGQPVIPKNFNPKNKPSKIISNPDTIFREMSFFHQEIIMLFAGSFLAFVLAVFGLLGYIPDGAFYGVIVLAAIMWIGFIIKRTFFQPVGKKSIVIRFFQNGGVDIGVGAIKDKVLNFDGKKGTNTVQITNIRRHWHTLTGRPVVALVEDYPENVSVLKDFKPTMESQDLSTLVTNTAQTYYNLGRRDEARKQSGLSITSILLIGCLIATIIAIVLIANQSGMLQEIIKILPGALG